MDDQAREIGYRVRYWRQRRGLDRRRFADMVGRSTSWLDKIETGERNLLRLPMLERVADALGVDSAVLTPGSTARRASACVDAVEIHAIRTALSQYPSLSWPSGERVPPTAEGVSQRLSYVTHAWLSSHFTVVARNLPTLLCEAQAVALTARSTDQVTSARALVAAYRLASSMLLKFQSNDVAWLAADRAMHAAIAVDDTLALARATRSVARAMTSTGQRASAIEALTHMADRMRPELATRERELLALYGMLYLAASIAAAGQEDADAALVMHREAAAAARRLGPDHQTHHTIFGHANVAAHRVAVLVRLHEGGRAVEYAESIDPGAIAALPPERRVNYLLDMTQALSSTGRYRDAVRMLVEAERTAPEEVRCRPLSHGLLRTLLNHTSGESSRLVRQVASRAGVAA